MAVRSGPQRVSDTRNSGSQGGLSMSGSSLVRIGCPKVDAVMDVCEGMQQAPKLLFISLALVLFESLWASVTGQ